MHGPIRSVLLFPGQGAYRADTLRSLADRHAQVGESFAQIDAVLTRSGGAPITPQLLTSAAPTIQTLLTQAPDVLQLAIFGTSVALHRILAANGFRAEAILGHSLGEIAALVAGGAYTVTQGAELVIARNIVLQDASAGGMVALGCNAERAGRLLDVLGNPWTSIATQNGSDQTVISGPDGAIHTACSIAVALGISATRLPSPYAFHSQLLAALVAPLADRIRHLPAGPLTTPVFSTTLGRFYRPDDQIPELIARALVAPAHFSGSVQQLADAGATSFVECGGGAALTGLIRRSLPSVTASAGSELLARLTDESTGPAAPAPSVRAVPAISVAAPAIPTSPEAPMPAAGETATAGPDTRDALFAELVAMYAQALEYPTEVFTESVSLEADLGIDSVKQTELLARAADRYGLPETQPDGFRLADHDTMGKVVDYLWSVRGGFSAGAPVRRATIVRSAPATPAAEPIPLRAPDGTTGPSTRDALFAELVAMYAQALEYPTEVFTESVSLEADLGIDSVKQTELLARAADRYGLPETQPDGFRLADHDTMGKVVDYLWSITGPARQSVVADLRVVAA